MLAKLRGNFCNSYPGEKGYTGQNPNEVAGSGQVCLYPKRVETGSGTAKGGLRPPVQVLFAIILLLDVKHKLNSYTLNNFFNLCFSYLYRFHFSNFYKQISCIP